MGHHATFSVQSLVTVTMVLAAASSIAGGRTHPPGSLVFLTRDGCANTATMRTRLDAALDRLGAPTDYDLIDADSLADGGHARANAPDPLPNLTALCGRSSVHGCA